jgi:hypothetical protein
MFQTIWQKKTIKIDELDIVSFVLENVTMNDKSNLLEKARLELGEDEQKKRQGIEFLRAWIKSQPNIRNCRQGDDDDSQIHLYSKYLIRCFLDDEFLVRFLRHSKYSLVRATEELKCYLSCPKLYPKSFGSFDVHEPKFSKIFNSNIFLVMPDVDADGCRIAIHHAANLNIDNVSFEEFLKFMFTLEETVSNMEEAQIAGVKLILDYSGTSMKHFSLLKPSDYRSMGKVIKNPQWYRLKAAYVLNLPSYAVHIANFLMKFVNEKMKERIKFIMDKSELEDHMDVNLLTQEFGGKVSIEESQNYMKKLLEEMQDKILLLNKIDADFEDIDREATGSSEFEFGPMGSFKKLEID